MISIADKLLFTSEAELSSRQNYVKTVEGCRHCLPTAEGGGDRREGTGAREHGITACMRGGGGAAAHIIYTGEYNDYSMVQGKESVKYPAFRLISEL
jgi:hypothetical protein